MPPNKNATPAKQLEDSSMTFAESEDMSFHLSRVESLVKGFVSKGELDQGINKLKEDLEKNMQGSMKTFYLGRIEERMGPMDDKIGRIAKLLQLQGKKIPKEEEVDQGTNKEKNIAHVEIPSMNKHDLKGFDSNMGSN